MKIALIHDWLTTYGGAERVLDALREIYPAAPIYTTIYNPAKFPHLKDAKIIPSYLNRFPLAKSHHQIFIPLMPRAVESYDLADFDLILSDSHACAKGAMPGPKATHICYCHTPMRYVWSPDIDPRASSSFLRRFVAKRLKSWDLRTTDRVHHFIANSNYIHDRIQNAYHRDSVVVYPPVETSHWQTANKTDDYFLYVGRLVDYKKPAIVVEAFNKLGRKLKIVGSGPQFDQLRLSAKSNIEFLGRLPDNALKDVYSKCLALIFPTIDDFGIVPVEVMASGRPVIAIDIGGAAETVVEGKTGHLFHEQSAEAIIDAVKSFKPENYDSSDIRDWSLRFDKSVFQSRIRQIVDKYTSSP